MTKCYIKRAGIDKKIEITDVEYNKQKHLVTGYDLDGNEIRVPAEDVIIEEDFNDNN